MRAHKLRLLVAAITLSCAPTRPSRVDAPPREQRAIAHETVDAPEPEPVQEETTVEGARARIDEARANLDGAVADLKKGRPEDADVNAARAAAQALKAAIDAGSKLESKDLTYAKLALEARRALRMHREVIDRRWVEIGVENARADIERALVDLKGAMDRLQSKEVVEEDFQLARAAANEVDAALERGQPMVGKSSKFGTWVGSVKSKLATHRRTIDGREVKVLVDRQRALVEESRRALADVLASLKPNDAADERFEEARATVSNAEKILAGGEALVAKDRQYAVYSIEVKKRFQEARAKIDKRQLEVAIHRQRVSVTQALSEMKRSLAGLAAPEGVSEAEASIQLVEKTLAAGQQFVAKDPIYAGFVNETKKATAEATKRVEKRKLEVAVLERKSLIEETLAIAKGGLETVEEESSTSKDVADGVAKLRAVREAVAKGAALEPLDARHASYATSVRKQIERIQAGLDEAKHVIAFREGPAKALSEGEVVAESVADSMGLEQRKSAHAKALALFEKCEREGTKMIEDHPHVGSAKAKSVVESCSERAKTTEEKLTAVKAVLAFYDGPAKSFEKAKELGKSGKSSEALSHFESCLEKGKVLQYKHPELNEQQFEVAGGKITLPAVVAECQKGAKALRVNVQHAKK